MLASNKPKNMILNHLFSLNIFYFQQLTATIQDRINAAISGDTVWVDPGTYNVTLKDGIVLKSKSGAKTTIINGNVSGSVISASGLKNTTVIDGFTINSKRVFTKFYGMERMLHREPIFIYLKCPIIQKYVGNNSAK